MKIEAGTPVRFNFQGQRLLGTAVSAPDEMGLVDVALDREFCPSVTDQSIISNVPWEVLREPAPDEELALLAIIEQAKRHNCVVLGVDLPRSVVLCKRGDEFVTWRWSFSPESGSVEFFWGHYTEDAGAAHKDFQER